MVARIEAGHSLLTALNYNEKKVAGQKAVLLEAGYYLLEASQLSFKQKLARLADRISLNPRVKVNVLHISLNFAPGENLPVGKLKEIAALYLVKIGFSGQPYLLYQHLDAGHPHLHLVTINIRQDGSRINLHNIGKFRSKKARSEIEEEFGLIKASDRKRQNAFEPKSVKIQPCAYGRTETKQAISAVLRHVLEAYKFSSLAELNAALGQYRLVADRGSEDSRTYKRNGLYYRVLDEKGNKVGVPIKASDFHFKPTLKNLSKRFEGGKAIKARHRLKLKNTLDTVLRENHSLDSLSTRLEQEGIRMVKRISETGLLYGITFVDNRSRSVFNGRELGKAYAANGILARCTREPINKTSTNSGTISPAVQVSAERSEPTVSEIMDSPDSDKQLKKLIAPSADHTGLPWQLQKAALKRRRKNQI